MPRSESREVVRAAKAPMSATQAHPINHKHGFQSVTPVRRPNAPYNEAVTSPWRFKLSGNSSKSFQNKQKSPARATQAAGRLHISVTCTLMLW